MNCTVPVLTVVHSVNLTSKRTRFSLVANVVRGGNVYRETLRFCAANFRNWCELPGCRRCPMLIKLHLRDFNSAFGDRHFSGVRGLESRGVKRTPAARSSTGRHAFLIVPPLARYEACLLLNKWFL